MIATQKMDTFPTFEIVKQVEIAAPMEIAFESLLEELGPEGHMPPNKPFPMIVEAWPGGRWYRDLGNNAGHLWGHVQVIKPPSLLEIWGPLAMPFPVVNHVQYRLTAEGAITRLVLTHRALGHLQPEFLEGASPVWQFRIDRARDLAERLRRERGV